MRWLLNNRGFVTICKSNILLWKGSRLLLRLSSVQGRRMTFKILLKLILRLIKWFYGKNTRVLFFSLMKISRWAAENRSIRARDRCALFVYARMITWQKTRQIGDSRRSMGPERLVPRQINQQHRSFWIELEENFVFFRGITTDYAN